VPSERAAQFENAQFTKVKYYEIGIGAGYAYTLVIKKHWFITASAIPSLSGGYLQQFDDQHRHGSFYLRPNFLFRPSIGYNSKKFNCSLYWFSSYVNAGNRNGYYHVNTSNARATIAYRFNPTPRTKRVYQKILNLNPAYRKQQKSVETE
jgi:hypothetical protein